MLNILVKEFQSNYLMKLSDGDLIRMIAKIEVMF